MKKFCLITVLTCFTLGIFAQNYQTVNSGRIACFKKEADFTEFIKVDSVKFSSDSVFYFQMGIFGKSDQCYQIGASWLGAKAIIRNNGDNIFYNNYSDSVLIKTKALLNESWLCMERKDQLKIYAQVIKCDTLTFLGLKDSVKTIGFKVYNSNMQLQNSDLNNYTLLLSKNYGFVRVLNFKLFPDYTDHNPYPTFLKEYDILGLSNPKVGIQNLTWFDAFDFQPGDEIHKYSYYNPGFSGGGITKILLKERYLERWIDIDTIVYRIDREKGTTIKYLLDSTFSYLHDTIEFKVYPNPQFDKLPEEPTFNGNPGDFSNVYIYTMTSAQKPNKYINGIFYYLNDSCLNILHYSGCFSNGYYQKGLGGPYFYCWDNITFVEEETKLVYYKKGTETWGTPLIITSLPQNKTIENKINVHYAAGSLQIKVNSNNAPCSFELYDINGRLLRKTEIKSPNAVINANNLKGMYFYKAIFKNQVLGTGKIMVK